MLNSSSNTSASSLLAAEALSQLLPRLTAFLKLAFGRFRPAKQESAVQDMSLGRLVLNSSRKRVIHT